jgi:hypothetical protein
LAVEAVEAAEAVLAAEAVSVLFNPVEAEAEAACLVVCLAASRNNNAHLDRLHLAVLDADPNSPTYSVGSAVSVADVSLIRS